MSKFKVDNVAFFRNTKELPAAVDATWLPWSSRSKHNLSLLQTLRLTLPPNSSWALCIPKSRTMRFIPSPAFWGYSNYCRLLIESRFGDACIWVAMPKALMITPNKLFALWKSWMVIVPPSIISDSSRVSNNCVNFKHPNTFESLLVMSKVGRSFEDLVLLYSTQIVLRHLTTNTKLV